MRELTYFQAMSMGVGKSQAMTITRAIFHTGLWWPLWWGWVKVSQWGVAWSILFKFLNLANSFYMIIFWDLARNVARGTPSSDRDQVKLALWVVVMFILMELAHIWASLNGP